MTGEMHLLMAQADDAPGELLAEVLNRLEHAGARNLQLVSSLTKKGRPGYILYIDVPAALEDRVAEILAFELGVWGYRVLAAEHKHFAMERRLVKLTVTMAADAHDFDLRVKTISRDGEFLRVKAEHDDLSRICGALRAAGCRMPLAELKARVETVLIDQRDSVAIEVNGS